LPQGVASQCGFYSFYVVLFEKMSELLNVIGFKPNIISPHRTNAT